MPDEWLESSLDNASVTFNGEDIRWSKGLEKDAQEIVRALSLAFLNERFVVPTKKSEKVNVDPYTERGFAGFDHMTPWSPMKR